MNWYITDTIHWYITDTLLLYCEQLKSTQLSYIIKDQLWNSSRKPVKKYRAFGAKRRDFGSNTFFKPNASVIKVFRYYRLNKYLNVLEEFKLDQWNSSILFLQTFIILEVAAFI